MSIGGRVSERLASVAVAVREIGGTAIGRSERGVTDSGNGGG